MALNQIDQIIKENFNLADRYTRKVVLEADDTQLISALAKALYDKIVAKVDKIDFGTIPKSRGDITKVDGFNNTVECLNIMRRLVLEYNENPQMVDTVITAIDNIRDSKAMFIKGFSLNVELATILYNLLVLSIEHSVSYLIAVTIQYVKDPSSQTLKAALDKEAYQDVKGNILYQQIEAFNASYASGDFVAMVNDAIKRGGKVSESLETVCPNCGCYPCSCNAQGETPIASPFGDYDDQSQPAPSPEVPDAPEHPEYDEYKYSEYLDSEEDAPAAGSEVPPRNDDEGEEGPVEPVNGSADSGDEDYAYDEANLSYAIDKVKQLGYKIGIGADGKEKPIPLPGWVRVTGLVAGGAAAVAMGIRLSIWLVKVCLPMLRSITFFITHTVVKFSDTLATQAQFIEMNAKDLEYSSNMDETKKKKVIDKQLRIAEKLRKLANFFAIDNKKASKAAGQDEKNDSKDKVTIPDGGDDDGGIF